MSSIARRIQKKQSRNRGSYQGTPQPVIAQPDGGYKTLHPTRGWMKVSGKRVNTFKGDS